MIRIVQGNDVNLHVPFVEKDAEGHVTPVDFSNITDLAVSLSKGSVAFTDFTYYTVNNTVVICLNENAPRGSYNIMITAKNNGVDICYNASSAFEIVRYNAESTYVDYIAQEDVTIDTALFVASIINDAEITELREELRNKIAETESAKEAYEEKSSNLTAVAEVVEDIPDLAKQGNDPEATNTAIMEAVTKGGGNPSKMAYDSMKSITPYLYAIEYSELDYEGARDYFATHFAPINGACTALRKGDKVGRNYDWTYDKQVEFLVRTKAHDGRYASIGVAGSIAALTTDTIGEYSEEFKYMPFRMLDGVNEKGVYCNVNMLNNAEGRTLPTTGTTPLIEEREAICSATLVRYILDNFATPLEACEYIRNYVRVYPPYHDGKTTDLHFAISSKAQLYYLCFEQENGVWHTMYVDVANQPLPFVMTNFRMWQVQGIFDGATGYYNRFKDADYSDVEKYGMGIERANLCLDFVRDTETTQSVLDFMTNDLRYTNAYLQSVTPTWLTEFVGQYSEEELARNSAAEDFERILGIVRQRYAERSRETGLTWQTVHSAVYDLDRLTIQLVTQEGNAGDAITIDCFKSLPASKGDLENIDIDLSPVAKEAQATMNKNEILSAIGAIPSPQGMATEANLNAKSADILAAISAAVASILGTDTTATLTAILSAITGIDFSELATEANATLNKTTILNAISQIDFSDLAKQGSNTGATNTAILSAVQNIVLPPSIAEKSDITGAVTALRGSDTTQTLTALADAIENVSVVEPIFLALQEKGITLTGDETASDLADIITNSNITLDYATTSEIVNDLNTDWNSI